MVKSQYGELHFLILQEIVINGSLLSSEVTQIILARTQQTGRQINELQIQKCIEELLNNNFLIGASSSLKPFEEINEKKSIKSKRKEKEEQKQMQIDEKKQDQEFEFPIKINSLKFLAEERRQGILDFAALKLQQNKLDFTVFRAMVNRHQNLSCLVMNNELLTQRETLSFTPNDVTQLLFDNGIQASEKDVISAMERLQQDSATFILKIGYEKKRDQSIYQINWKTLFLIFQELLIFKIIEETSSKYHTRVLKILRTNGFLEENDITKMCLLTQKDTRALINQLLSEGIIVYQEVPMKQGPPMMMYGVNYNACKQTMSLRLAQCVVNLLIKEKSLNYKALITRELNTLII